MVGSRSVKPPKTFIYHYFNTHKTDSENNVNTKKACHYLNKENHKNGGRKIR